MRSATAQSDLSREKRKGPPPIDAKTAAAFEDLRRGIAQKMGWDEADTQLVICRPNPIEQTDDDRPPAVVT